jgi:hypothetical protein
VPKISRPNRGKEDYIPPHRSYDSAKSEANKRKHGIDFEEASALWNDPFALQIELGCPV